MTIRYFEGFDGSGLDLGLGASEIYFPTQHEEGPVQAHISLINGRFYLEGKEVSPAEGEKLLDDAIKEGKPYTIFQTIARGEGK